MSIGITCNISDGVILGADSAITISGKALTPSGMTEGVLKVYNDAEKVYQISDLPIGIVTCGIAMIGSRTFKSYINEFEYEEKKEKLSKLNLEQICKFIYSFFMRKYEETFKKELETIHGKKYEEIPDNKKPMLGIAVAGFSPKAYLSEVWQVSIPKKEEKEAIIKLRDKGVFGTNWFGIYGSISRLIKGYDNQLLDQVIGYLVNKFKIDIDTGSKAEIKKILDQYEHKIPYNAMPLQEGVDHVKFLLDVVINETKFVIGAQICGGKVRVAVIDRDNGFRYVTDTNLKIRIL